MVAKHRRSDRGSVALIVSIIVVVLVIVVLIFHFLSRRQPTEVKNFQELVTRVDKLNTQITEREQNIMELVRKYNQSHPESAFDTTGIAAMGLNPDQAEIIQRRVAQEKDISYRGLLQEVLDLNGQIDGLMEEMQDLRAKLPAPHEVKQGDSHLKVCLEFLSEKGVTEDEALKLIEQTALTAELLPGFEVWNYYNEGVFGTFVTQGTAKLSPNALARATKRRIDTERQNLIQARNQKEQEVQDLEARRDELNNEIRRLDEERTQMMAQMNEMAERNEGLAKELNTVTYVVATFRDLDRQGVIGKPAVGKWATKDMNKIQNTSSLDLRSEPQITFTAASLGLGRISKILVFPRTFEDGKDYRIVISDDRQSATIVFDQPERFRLAKLAVAVD